MRNTVASIQSELQRAQADLTTAKGAYDAAFGHWQSLRGSGCDRTELFKAEGSANGAKRLLEHAHRAADDIRRRHALATASSKALAALDKADAAALADAEGVVAAFAQFLDTTVRTLAAKAAASAERAGELFVAVPPETRAALGQAPSQNGWSNLATGTVAELAHALSTILGRSQLAASLADIGTVKNDKVMPVGKASAGAFEEHVTTMDSWVQREWIKQAAGDR